MLVVKKPMQCVVVGVKSILVNRPCSLHGLSFIDSNAIGKDVKSMTKYVDKNRSQQMNPNNSKFWAVRSQSAPVNYNPPKGGFH
jgi:hypothetical protein